MSQQKLCILKTKSLRAASDSSLGVCHCSLALQAQLDSCGTGVSLQTPYCFTALLFSTAGAWSKWSVAGDSPREVLRGYVHRGCRYSHRAGPGNHWTEPLHSCDSAAVLQFVLLQALYYLLVIKLLLEIFGLLLGESQVPGKQDKIACQILTSKQCWMRCSLVIPAKPVDWAELLPGTSANRQPNFGPLRNICRQVGIL